MTKKNNLNSRRNLQDPPRIIVEADDNSIVEVTGPDANDVFTISDGTGNYGPNESATIKILGPATLVFTVFDIENAVSNYADESFECIYDFLIIEGEKYCGDTNGYTAPGTIILGEAKEYVITWSSDEIEEDVGFEFTVTFIKASGTEVCTGDDCDFPQKCDTKVGSPNEGKCVNPICETFMDCSETGDCGLDWKCECYSGFIGENCETYGYCSGDTDCGQGTCVND
eukprot:UN24463